MASIGSRRIGFGESADGVGEQARTGGIDDGDGEPAGVEKAMSQAVELAGRLHDHERDIVSLRQRFSRFRPWVSLANAYLKPSGWMKTSSFALQTSMPR